jgi:hypothetical protein
MKHLLLALALFFTIETFAQKERTFLMTSRKNELCTYNGSKWLVDSRTYANIEFEVVDGIIQSNDEGDSRYTPISKYTKTQKDGYSMLKVSCIDSKNRKCVVNLFKLDGETSLFMITIEFEFGKLFYYKSEE